MTPITILCAEDVINGTYYLFLLIHLDTANHKNSLFVNNKNQFKLIITWYWSNSLVRKFITTTGSKYIAV